MRLRSLVLLAAAVAGGSLAAPAAASPAEARPYVVVLQDEVRHPSDVAAEHRRRHGAQVTRTYGSALKGYAASLTPAAHAEVLRDPRVAFVEPDAVVTASSELLAQPDAPWGLDRIDQREVALDGVYRHADTATAVIAYVIDSGIRLDHPDFGGRAVSGFDAVDGGSADDCNGHGTHVAGTLGGTTHGVAKGVQLVSVRVLGCDGRGTLSGVVAGVDFVARDHAAGVPAVANMSLGSGASRSVDSAVKTAIADGVAFAVAAGNSGANACNYSPARVPEAMTIGATDQADARASFSNHGSCLDLFAPGVGITSTWHTEPTETISGTSMASPHAAGVAALHLTRNPGATPQQVRDALLTASTRCVVTSALSANNHLLSSRQDTSAPCPSGSTKPARK